MPEQPKRSRMSEDPGGDADKGVLTDDQDRPLCGVPKKHADGPCSHPVPNGNCPVHGDEDARLKALGKALADGRLDPEEVPVRAGVGSGDSAHELASNGGAPDGNRNALVHGLDSEDPFGLLDYFRDDEPRVYAQIAAWFWDEARNAPFPVYQGDREAPFDQVDLDAGRVPTIRVGHLTSKASELLLVMVNRGVIWRATLEQAQKGLAELQKRKDSDGNYVDVLDELRVNLPKNRIRREDRQALKDLGLRDESPEAQAAQGQRDLASAAERVALAREGGGADG